MLIESPKREAKRRIADLSTPSDDRLTSDDRPSTRMGFYLIGVGWVRFFLGESRSRLYPHMRAKFGRDPTAGSKKVPFKCISRLRINQPNNYRQQFKSKLTSSDHSQLSHSQKYPSQVANEYQSNKCACHIAYMYPCSE